jgi:phytoene synthase
MPVGVRPAVEALFAIDAAMADVVARSSDPALGRIKLAWWREQLEALDQKAAPAEPRLEAASRHLLPAGIAGRELAELEAGWATLLDCEPDRELIARRGAKLFELGGRLLGVTDARLGGAGALYALRCVGNSEAGEYLERLRGHRFPRSLRPLTMLARAAGVPGDRAMPLAMLAHRWSGKIR